MCCSCLWTTIDSNIDFYSINPFYVTLTSQIIHVYSCLFVFYIIIVAYLNSNFICWGYYLILGNIIKLDEKKNLLNKHILVE